MSSTAHRAKLAIFVPMLKKKLALFVNLLRNIAVCSGPCHEPDLLRCLQLTSLHCCVFEVGPPLSGKTTLAQWLAQQYRLKLLDPSQLIQEAVAAAAAAAAEEQQQQGGGSPSVSAEASSASGKGKQSNSSTGTVTTGHPAAAAGVGGAGAGAGTTSNTSSEVAVQVGSTSPQVLAAVLASLWRDCYNVCICKTRTWPKRIDALNNCLQQC
jgi:hypothetical protein